MKKRVGLLLVVLLLLASALMAVDYQIVPGDDGSGGGECTIWWVWVPDQQQYVIMDVEGDQCIYWNHVYVGP